MNKIFSAIPLVVPAIYNYSNIFFEGWKKKQHSLSIPSHIKAISIAVILVMSSMTTTNAGEIMNQVGVEQEQTPFLSFGRRVIENAEIDKSMIPERYKSYFDNTEYKDYKFGEGKGDKDYTCVSKWISIRVFSDKQFITASTIESERHHHFILASTIEYDEKYYDDDVPSELNYLLRSYNLEINHLELITILKRDKNGKYLGCTNHYYVCGPGWKYNVGAFDDRNEKEVPVNTNYKEDPNLQIEISEKLFDTIFEAHNKQLPVEKVITNVCYEE